eukprot:353939-Chlamydomonas_euryale.AAC.30
MRQQQSSCPSSTATAAVQVLPCQLPEQSNSAACLLSRSRAAIFLLSVSSRAARAPQQSRHGGCRAKRGGHAFLHPQAISAGNSPAGIPLLPSPLHSAIPPRGRHNAAAAQRHAAALEEPRGRERACRAACHHYHRRCGALRHDGRCGWLRGMGSAG